MSFYWQFILILSIHLSCVFFWASREDLPLPYLPPFPSPLGNRTVITKHNRGQGYVAKRVRKSGRVRTREREQEGRGDGTQELTTWPAVLWEQSLWDQTPVYWNWNTHTHIHTHTSKPTPVFLPPTVLPCSFGFLCWHTLCLCRTPPPLKGDSLSGAWS